MSYFHQIHGLPEKDLLTPLNQMLVDDEIKWSGDNQICINTIEESDDFLLGCGSLHYDWDNAEILVDESTGSEKIHVPEYETPMQESDFTKLCSVFQGTVFEEVYNELKKHYQVGRVRLMKSFPKTCLSWHVDNTPRIHYPVKTQEGCLMIIEDEVKYMPVNTWWKTDTLYKHTAINASKQDRIHLVTCVMETK